MSTVNLLRGDDWIGLYVDGELVLEGHSLSESTVIKVLTGTRPGVFQEYDWEAWDEWGNHCPPTWAAVKAHMAVKGEAGE